jgi:hypothetical protein
VKELPPRHATFLGSGNEEGACVVHLSEYRKLDPSPLEEAVLFDHPSGHTRILSAMRWKAEHARA